MPRLPSLKVARSAADRPVHIVGLDAFLDRDPAHYGLSGSPTQVERIFPPPAGADRELWRGEDSGDRLFDALRAWKFI